MTEKPRGPQLVPPPSQRDNSPRRVEAIAFDGDWVESLRIDRGAVERRIATLGGRRTVKKQWQAAWLLKAITCMDLTTLSGEDTEERVRRLCAKARHPVRHDLLEAMGAQHLPIKVGAVCVYHEMIAPALEALKGSGIPVAAVSTGFPAGLSPFALRLAEIKESVAAGAEEIDIVISRRHVLNSDWLALYEEVKAFREACGPAHLKAIIATGELGNMPKIAKASLVSMMAGADFIKTSNRHWRTRHAGEDAGRARQDRRDLVLRRGGGLAADRGSFSRQPQAELGQ